MRPLLIALSVLVLPGTIAAAAEAPRPNILLIITDDQGYWDLSCHGNEVINTPVMDSLAKQGVELTRFYVQPVCAPTRAGLMTGRYYLRTGVYNTRFGGDTMVDDEVTMAEMLQDAGYRTGIFGKWHLGTYARNWPQNQGFDESLCILRGHAERYDYPDQLVHNGQQVEARGYITTVFTDAAAEFIKSSGEQPFFCYLPYNVPHSPFVAGSSHDEMEIGDALIRKYLKRGLILEEARIYAMVERCDKAIGGLLKLLDELKLADNTIVLFMSDNGGVSKSYRAGLRGGKASAYEGGVRSPLFVRWPGHFPAGKQVDAITSHVDLLPTFADLLGLPLPENRQLDGRSILPLLSSGEGESPHEYLYHIWDRYAPTMESRWSIVGQRYKLTNDELYDLEKDPGEKQNIASSQPELAAELHEEFERWLADVTAGQEFQPPPIEIGRDDENPVELQASWAITEGENTVYNFRGYDWDTIESWREPGESAHWRLQVTTPGEYAVEISYGADEASAGSRLRLSADVESIEFKVRPTPSRDVFHRRKAGVLRLPAGPVTLNASVVEANGDELMTLNRIWLRKLGAER